MKKKLGRKKTVSLLQNMCRRCPKFVWYICTLHEEQFLQTTSRIRKVILNIAVLVPKDKEYVYTVSFQTSTAYCMKKKLSIYGMRRNRKFQAINYFTWLNNIIVIFNQAQFIENTTKDHFGEGISIVCHEKFTGYSYHSIS